LGRASLTCRGSSVPTLQERRHTTSEHHLTRGSNEGKTRLQREGRGWNGRRGVGGSRKGRNSARNEAEGIGGPHAQLFGPPRSLGRGRLHRSPLAFAVNPSPPSNTSWSRRATAALEQRSLQHQAIVPASSMRAVATAVAAAHLCSVPLRLLSSRARCAATPVARTPPSQRN
jgi:hypothetical protein